MIFKIVKATPIKEFVIRFSVELYEMQGPCEVLHSAYDIAQDVQQYVNGEKEESSDVIRLDINDSAIFQELTNSIAMLQLTAGVAKRLTGARWNVLHEGEDESKDVEKLSD